MPIAMKRHFTKLSMIYTSPQSPPHQWSIHLHNLHLTGSVITHQNCHYKDMMMLTTYKGHNRSENDTPRW